jgi:hypothetical protein
MGKLRLAVVDVWEGVLAAEERLAFERGILANKHERVRRFRKRLTLSGG